MSETATRKTAEDLAELRRRLLTAVRRVCPAWLAAQDEDIVQEALLKINRVLEREGETNQPLPASYINKVAYHAMVDAIRRCRQQHHSEIAVEEGLEEMPDNEQSANPEQIRATGRLQEGLQGCLEDMVENRRTAVVLRLQGHSVPEIGRLMGWTQTRANNLVFRGMSDLRLCLETKGLAP